MALGVLKAKMTALQEKVDESEKKANMWKGMAEEEKRLRERVIRTIIIIIMLIILELIMHIEMHSGE